MKLSYFAKLIDITEALAWDEVGSAPDHIIAQIARLEMLSNEAVAETQAERLWRAERLIRAVDNEWLAERLMPLAHAIQRDAGGDIASTDVAELISFVDSLAPDNVGPIPAGVIRAVDAIAAQQQRHFIG